MESERIPRSLAGLDQMFAFLKGHLEAGSVDEGTSFRINLAAEEIFVNMVKHNEGSRLAEGPLVEEITPDGVVLSMGGETFLLPRD